MGNKKEFDLNADLKVDDALPKKKVDEVKTISYIQLFRFSTRRDLFFIILGLVASVGTGVLQPLNTKLYGTLTGQIIDYAANKTTADELMDQIETFALLNTGIGLGMFVLSYIFTEAFNYSALKQIFRIRSLYMEKVLNQDITWYDLHQTGDFASRMSDDLSKLEDGIGEKVPTFISMQVVFITSLIIALVQGWELALICLTSLPLSLIAIGIIGILTSKLAKNELDAYGSAGSIAEEVLSALRTVLAFGGQTKETNRYDDQLVFAKNNNIKRAFMTAFGFGLLWFFIFGSYALAFWYGVKLVLEENHESNPTYTPGNMVTVFFSVMTGSMNFGMSSPFIEAFSVANAAGAKIYHVIDILPIINLSKNVGTKLSKIEGNIVFKNVKFRYPSREEVPILQGFDLEIKAGDTVALVGSSGCGKSTCIQLLQRFYDPLEGEVCLDNHNLKDLDLTWLRQNIGVVGQEPVLFGTTIMENIKYGNRNATEEEVKNATKKANAHEFIKSLPNGYHTLVGERGAQLSGGQKQRIAIARALIKNPSILLLDEATSALDTNSEAKVQGALDSASESCTTIIVAHRLSTIRGANKIVVVSNGKVVEQGTHDQLMELENEYFNLVTTQVQASQIGSSERSDIKETFEDERKESIIENEIVLEDLDDALQARKTSYWHILKMIAPEKYYIFIGCVGSAVMGCVMPVFAIIFGNILGVLYQKDRDDYVRTETNKYCIYFIIAGVVAGLSTFCQIFMFSIAGEKLTMRIRSQMFKALLKQEVGYFDRKDNGVGALCAKLSGDAAQVQGATGQRIGTILQSIGTIIFAVTISMFYEWRLAFVALAFAPPILIATFLQGRQSTGNNEKRQNSLEQSTKLAVDAVSNVRTVVSLGCEETFHGLYIEELEKHQKAAISDTHFRSIVFALSRSVMFFAYSACLYYGGVLITDGLAYDKVFKVSQALIMGTATIANTLAFTPNMQKGLTAAVKVLKLLNRVPKIQDDANAKEIPLGKGNIDYSQIRFSYPTRPTIEVLKGLDLSVLQGKTVALVGPSGCGKSTIIQLIERFYDPFAGNVSFNERNLPSIKLESLRSHMGIVSQEPNLFNRTIGENIAYGDNTREVSENEIIEAAKNANIHNFITQLPTGYDTSLGEKGTQLSGGQKQRIAIARALVRNPKVLLLDEATSALDTESEKIVQEALDNAKKGRTCITIAHRLTTIQDADLICVVNQGVVAEIGTHTELLTNRGLYYKLHSLQNK